MEYRILEQDEFHKVTELSTKVMGFMRDKDYVLNIKLSDNLTIIGTFDEQGELVAAITCYRFNTLPAFLVGQFIQLPGLAPVFSWKDSHAVHMMDIALSVMEQEGRKTWYYARSIEKWPTKLRKKGNDFFSNSEQCQRYQRYLEEFIPKNTFPVWPTHKDLMPKVTWPYDIILVKCCLKNKFRNIDYKFEEDYDEI